MPCALTRARWFRSAATLRSELRPASGSSSRTICGSTASARATSSRFIWPSGSDAGKLGFGAGQADANEDFGGALALAFAADIERGAQRIARCGGNRPPSTTLSSTVISRNGRTIWCVSASPLRTRAAVEFRGDVAAGERDASAVGLDHAGDDADAAWSCRRRSVRSVRQVRRARSESSRRRPRSRRRNGRRRLSSWSAAHHGSRRRRATRRVRSGKTAGREANDQDQQAAEDQQAVVVDEADHLRQQRQADRGDDDAPGRADAADHHHRHQHAPKG